MSMFGDGSLERSMHDEYSRGREYGFSEGFIEGYKKGYNDGKSLKGDDIISRKESIKAIHDEYDEVLNIDESGEWNSGDRNSGNWNSWDWNSGDWNSGNLNSGDWNSGSWNSGNWNSGDWNSVDGNSGSWNKCDLSSGVFCNETDTDIRIFNKPSGMSMREFMDSKFYKVLTSVSLEFIVYKEYTDVLFIVFLILKLTHVIDWSWVWVFAPLWIDLLIITVVLVAVFINRKIIQRYN